MIFNYLVFDPKKYGKPVYINEEGGVIFKKLCDDPTFMDIYETFLRKRSNPYIYFSGTHFIPMLEVLEKTHVFKKMKGMPKVDFFFFEPLTHYIKFGRKSFMPHILNINNNDFEISQVRCAELDSISAWVEKNHIKNLTVYCTDYGSEKHYQKIYKNLNLKCMDVFTVSNCVNIAKAKHFPVRAKKEDIIKKFICPAWRYDISRHVVISYLAEKDLIKNNNVSFYYDIPNKILKDNLWANWKEINFKFPKFSETILNGNTKLRTLVPLSIEIENPRVMGECEPNVVNVAHSHRPYDSYREAFLSVVLESRVTQPWPNVSEKTLNPIFFRRPFIVLGAPNTMKWLKDMGFKTFDKYWDESYDSIWDNTERIVKFCETVEKISSFTIEEMREMYEDMTLIFDHNIKNAKYVEKYFKNYNK